MAFTHFFGKHKKVASCGRRSHFPHCGWSQWPAIQTGISNGCIHASHYRLPPPTASHCLDLLVTARSTSSRERKVGGYSLWPVVWLNIDRRSREETGTMRFKYEEILWYSESTVKKRKKMSEWSLGSESNVWNVTRSSLLHPMLFALHLHKERRQLLPPRDP